MPNYDSTGTCVCTLLYLNAIALDINMYCMYSTVPECCRTGYEPVCALPTWNSSGKK